MDVIVSCLRKFETDMLEANAAAPTNQVNNLVAILDFTISFILPSRTAFDSRQRGLFR